MHDVAHTYPEIEVTGIDISHNMIAYARAHAEVRGLTNAHFQVMNALEQLDFPDASFDLVNARAALGFVPTPDMASAHCRIQTYPAPRRRISVSLKVNGALPINQF